MGTQLRPRDIDILLCLGRGLCDKEIATELGIGCNTVKTYVLRIRKKTNLCRIKLAIYGKRLQECSAS